MATLSELVATIAKAEGMDLATVALFARYVREAGFIEKKGRGPSAANMGVKDAANLLIAINAASSVRAAASVVPVYKSLVAIGDETIHGTFGEALELLIASAIEGKLPGSFLSKDVSDIVRDSFERGKSDISISFERPSPSVSFHIAAPSRQEEFAPGVYNTITPVFGAIFFPTKRASRKVNLGDRKDRITIGNVTIFSVAERLR